MKKIPTLFKRDMFRQPALVINEVNPGCEWVLAGEGIATQKFDGTCCLIQDGKLYKRYEVRLGQKQPINFEAATEIDSETGKIQGWVPVGNGPDDKWHREAFATVSKWAGFDKGYIEQDQWSDGTYELCGPKVQGNPEGFKNHCLIPHGYGNLFAFPRTFEEIKEAFSNWKMEGVVWHHPDGRMVKIKVRDFGFKRSKT